MYEHNATYRFNSKHTKKQNTYTYSNNNLRHISTINTQFAQYENKNLQFLVRYNRLANNF